jgi:hypothetical protein
MSTTLTPHSIDFPHEHAFAIARLVAELSDYELNELHAAVRERLGRGIDLDGLEPSLRPLLNRILDVVERPSDDPAEGLRLEQLLFG